MLKFINHIFIISFMVVLISCSSSKDESEKPGIEVKSYSVDCWLNLMPGAPGKFFMNGEMKIKNLTEDDINKIEFNRVTVYSNKEVVYTFTPFTETENGGYNLSLKSASEKSFRFGTKRGLKMDERLISNDKIDMSVEMMYDGKKFVYDIKDIKVERAY